MVKTWKDIYDHAKEDENDIPFKCTWALWLLCISQLYQKCNAEHGHMNQDFPLRKTAMLCRSTTTFINCQAFLKWVSRLRYSVHFSGKQKLTKARELQHEYEDETLVAASITFPLRRHRLLADVVWEVVDPPLGNTLPVPGYWQRLVKTAVVFTWNQEWHFSNMGSSFRLM